MPNLTVSEWHVTVRRTHAIAPDLTAMQVEEAIRSALITQLGWSVVSNAEKSGDLKIVVS
jgi:hypothetical protein